MAGCRSAVGVLVALLLAAGSASADAGGFRLDCCDPQGTADRARCCGWGHPDTGTLCVAGAERQSSWDYSSVLAPSRFQGINFDGESRATLGPAQQENRWLTCRAACRLAAAAQAVPLQHRFGAMCPRLYPLPDPLPLPLPLPSPATIPWPARPPRRCNPALPVLPPPYPMHHPHM